MNDVILSAEVQSFLHKSLNANPKAIALQKSPFAFVSSSELATQLESRQKTENKIPILFKTSGIYFPPTIAIEQASSKETALYKTSLIEENTSLIDITGGIGIDSYYFSKRAKRVVHCEINENLSKIAAHNAGVLKAKNIEFYKGDGLKFLEYHPSNTFQTLYADPSRRVKTQKVFMLKDCEPNVVELQQLLFKKVPKIIIKAAPLLDISLSISELNNVKEVHIISLKNECKELLFVLEKDYEGHALLHAVGLGSKVNFNFTFYQEEERNAQAVYGPPTNFLFDPDVALLKAGCFKLLSVRYKLDKLHISTHLYTSANSIHNFPGRSFEIVKTYEYKNFKKEKTNWEASVISKNFPLKVADLRKKHKIKESNINFLFFCKGINEKLIVIAAKRLMP